MDVLTSTITPLGTPYSIPNRFSPHKPAAVPFLRPARLPPPASGSPPPAASPRSAHSVLFLSSLFATFATFCSTLSSIRSDHRIPKPPDPFNLHHRIIARLQILRRLQRKPDARRRPGHNHRPRHQLSSPLPSPSLALPSSHLPPASALRSPPSPADTTTIFRSADRGIEPGTLDRKRIRR